jgi:hypothetical protein
MWHPLLAKFGINFVDKQQSLVDSGHGVLVSLLFIGSLTAPYQMTYMLSRIRKKKEIVIMSREQERIW